jgi:hypothetical protein
MWHVVAISQPFKHTFIMYSVLMLYAYNGAVVANSIVASSNYFPVAPKTMFINVIYI